MATSVAVVVARPWPNRLWRTVVSRCVAFPVCLSYKQVMHKEYQGNLYTANESTCVPTMKQEILVIFAGASPTAFSSVGRSTTNCCPDVDQITRPDFSSDGQTLNFLAEFRSFKVYQMRFGVEVLP